MDNNVVSVLKLIKFLLRGVNDKLHIAQVVHLLLAICDTLFIDCITCVTKLSVHVVTWEENELNALIAINIILDAPDD